MVVAVRPDVHASVEHLFDLRPLERPDHLAIYVPQVAEPLERRAIPIDKPSRQEECRVDAALHEQRQGELIIVGVTVVERDGYNRLTGRRAILRCHDLAERHASAVLSKPSEVLGEELRRSRAEWQRRVHGVVTQYDDPASRVVGDDSSEQFQRSFDRRCGSQCSLSSL